MTGINTVVALICFANWCAQQVESMVTQKSDTMNVIVAKVEDLIFQRELPD